MPVCHVCTKTVNLETVLDENYALIIAMDAGLIADPTELQIAINQGDLCAKCAKALKAEATLNDEEQLNRNLWVDNNLSLDTYRDMMYNMIREGVRLPASPSN